MTNDMSDIDRKVRIAAFNWLAEQVRIHGDVLPRSILETGFEFENHRIPLVSPQGIFKPRLLPNIPLSITTTPKGPYDDSFDSDGLLLYRYRGTDPQHRDNAGLRISRFRQRFQRRAPNEPALRLLQSTRTGRITQCAEV